MSRYLDVIGRKVLLLAVSMLAAAGFLIPQMAQAQPMPSFGKPSGPVLIDPPQPAGLPEREQGRCVAPSCWMLACSEIEVVFDPATLRVVSLDVLNNRGRVWRRLPRQAMSRRGLAAASKRPAQHRAQCPCAGPLSRALVQMQPRASTGFPRMAENRRQRRISDPRSKRWATAALPRQWHR